MARSGQARRHHHAAPPRSLQQCNSGVFLAHTPRTKRGPWRGERAPSAVPRVCECPPELAPYLPTPLRRVECRFFLAELHSRSAACEPPAGKERQNQDHGCTTPGTGTPPTSLAIRRTPNRLLVPQSTATTALLPAWHMAAQATASQLPTTVPKVECESDDGPRQLESSCRHGRSWSWSSQSWSS